MYQSPKDLAKKQANICCRNCVRKYMQDVETYVGHTNLNKNVPEPIKDEKGRVITTK